MNIYKNVKFFINKKFFSFVLKAEAEGNSTDTYIKNEKKLSVKKTEAQSHQDFEFDSENTIINIEGKSEQVFTDESTEESKTYEVSQAIQCDAKNVYTIDMNSKLYEKATTAQGKLQIEAIASSSLTSFLTTFALKAADPDLNFYIDKNVYTIEEKYTDEDKSITKNVKSIYQFTLLDDGYDYYEEESVEVNELNLKTVDVSINKVSMRKKNVSLKYVDVNKYLEIESIK